MFGLTSIASAASVNLTASVAVPSSATTPAPNKCYQPNQVNQTTQYTQSVVDGYGAGEQVCYEIAVDIADVKDTIVTVTVPEGMAYLDTGRFVTYSLGTPVAPTFSNSTRINARTFQVRVGSQGTYFQQGRLVFVVPAVATLPENGQVGETKTLTATATATNYQTNTSLTATPQTAGFKWKANATVAPAHVVTGFGTLPTFPGYSTRTITGYITNDTEAAFAYDTTIKLVIPKSLFPLNANGSQLVHGQTLPNGFAWDGYAKTFTLTGKTLAPGEIMSVQFTVKTSIAGGSGTSTLSASTWSRPDHAVGTPDYSTQVVANILP